MDEEKKAKNENVSKDEDVVKNDELESLEGGVSSQVHNASVGFSGITICCNDIFNDSQR